MPVKQTMKKNTAKHRIASPNKRTTNLKPNVYRETIVSYAQHLHHICGKLINKTQIFLNENNTDSPGLIL